MSALRSLLLVWFLLGLCIPTPADQTDARLDGLFNELKAASTRVQAAPVEQQIWSIWTEIPDASASALMQGGTDAMSRRDLSTSIAHLTALIELAPKFAEAWNKRATAHYLVGNYEQSLDDIARMLELEPRHFGALSGRGLVYVQLEDLANALASFEAALSIHPNMVGASANADAIRKMLGQREI